MPRFEITIALSRYDEAKGEPEIGVEPVVYLIEAPDQVAAYGAALRCLVASTAPELFDQYDVVSKATRLPD